jgi:long-chain acyl-CoA synthetase
MKGYLEGDLPVDEQGWLSSGDVGYLDEDGSLFLVDRLKDVFKHDNWLVSPVELESILSGHPGVEECAVVDQSDGAGGGVPVAFVVPRGRGASGDPTAELISFVNRQVPEYKQLRHIEVIDRIPRSANGKISRRHLREEMARRLSGTASPQGDGNHIRRDRGGCATGGSSLW